MTREELQNIAKRMDEETRDFIDGEVEERLAILRKGDLTEEELQQMEEYLYASLVLQEYLNGEYELLEEERQELFDEMEEMYNKYADLLVRARIEEKVSKKKRMTLELMKIREQLMNRKEDYKDIKQRMKDNRENYNKLKDLNKKENMKEMANPSKGMGGLGGLPGKGDIKGKPKDVNNLKPRENVSQNVKDFAATVAQVVQTTTDSVLQTMTNKASTSITSPQATETPAGFGGGNPYAGLNPSETVDLNTSKGSRGW